jgi:hypothetical protein
MTCSFYLHGFRLSLVEEAPPGFMIDPADGFDDAAQTRLKFSQKLEELLRNLRYHA